MRTCPALFLGAAILLPAAAQGAGFAYNEDFLVMAPDQATAEQLLQRASYLRQALAKEWFGEELPAGAGRVMICFKPSDTDDRGLTWPGTYPGRRFHDVWLRTTRERAMGSALHHEMLHCLFATRFQGTLPAWCDEGAASLVDDAGRWETRGQILSRFAATGRWPDLRGLLGAEAIARDDREGYAAATSLAEYLLSRGDKATFLRFAVEGKASGWDRALRRHYGIDSVADLEQAWQTWASKSVGVAELSRSGVHGNLPAAATPDYWSAPAYPMRRQ